LKNPGKKERLRKKKGGEDNFLIPQEEGFFYPLDPIPRAGWKKRASYQGEKAALCVLP